jgi:hypothetical protein
MRTLGIAAAEDRPGPRVDESDLVRLMTLVSEIGAVAVVDQGEDAAADGNPRFSRMACLLPGSTIRPDLGGLLYVEGLSCFVVLERRTLQVHTELCRPDRPGVRAGTPPDPLAQALGIGFEAQQSGRVRKHGLRVGLREAFAAQEVKEDLRMTPVLVVNPIGLTTEAESRNLSVL